MSGNGGFSSGSILGDVPLLPWEQGILGHIFADDPLENFPLPAPIPVGSDLPPPSAEPRVKKHAPPELPPGNAYFSKAFKNLSDKDFLAKRAYEIDKAFSKWEIICRRFHAGDSANTTQDHVDSLRASFGAKAPSTILKRANALLGFIRWSDSIGCSAYCIFSEATLWRFIQHLQAEEKTSQAGDVISALRWAHYVLDFAGVADIISRRCVGSSEQMQATKTFLMQADPLLVSECQALHIFSKDGEAQTMDRALAFFCLVCIYARCRVSDLDCVHDATWDVSEDGSGYLVLRVGWHKTSNLSQKKRVLLPLIVPLMGIDGLPFGNELWQVFSDLGILHEERCDKPFLCPYMRDGGLARRPITTSEVSTFLQLFLASKGFAVGERKITSHSLKHTGLSWVGKYGMSKEDQCILGHHSDSVRGTEAVYSYDLSIGSVQRFEVLLHYIASGEFVPDEPRSKFWKFPPKESVPEPATPGKRGPDERLPEVVAFLDATPPLGGLSPSPSFAQEVCEDEPTSEASVSEGRGSSSSSSDSSSTSVPSRKKLKVDPALRQEMLSSQGRWVVHVKSGMLHLKYGERLLSCGRAISAQFRDVVDADLDGRVCLSCRRQL